MAPPGKRRVANGTGKFVNDTPVSFTLSEARALAARPRFWLVFAGTAAVLALMGPFGTYEALTLPARALYWGVASLGAFWVGFLTSIATASQAEDWGVPPAPALILGGVAAALPISALFGVLNAVFLDVPFVSGARGALPYAAGIAVIVGAIYEMLEGRLPAPATDPAAEADWLARLPPEVGRDIVTLQAQDHYVSARTIKGEALVRSALSEAAAALGPQGLRVHRSWWAATAHMAGLEREGSALRLRLRDGTQVPVGRAYRKEVRAALRAAPGP